MKKFYFLLCLCTAIAFSGVARDVKFDFKGNEFNLPTTTNSSDSKGALDAPLVKENVKITFYKNDGTNPPLVWFSEYNNTIDLRCYNGNSFVIETTNGEPITAIAFDVANGKFGVAATPAGEWTGETFSTWTGNAPSVSFAVDANKAQLYGLTVTTLEGTVAVAAPRFTPEACSCYGDTEIAIETATEGASIYYTTDYSVPTRNSKLYTGPFTLKENTGITAIAMLGDAVSEISSKVYDFPEHQVVKSIAEFIALDTDDIVRIDNLVVVAYQSSNYIYLRDETASLQVYGTIDAKYTNGDVIPAGITGTRNLFRGSMQLLPIAHTFRAASGTASALPYVKMLSEITADMTNTYVIVKDINVDITKDGNNNVYTLRDASGVTLPLYEKFKNITMPTASGVYDVIGIVNLYNTTLQLYPVAVNNPGAAALTVAEGVSVTANNGMLHINAPMGATTNVYSISGALLHSTTSTELPISAGVYIVTVNGVPLKVVAQ